MTRKSFIAALMLCFFAPTLLARSPRLRHGTGFVESVDLKGNRLVVRFENSGQKAVFRITVSVRKQLAHIPSERPIKATWQYSEPTFGERIIHKISFSRE